VPSRTAVELGCVGGGAGSGDARTLSSANAQRQAESAEATKANIEAPIKVDPAAAVETACAVVNGIALKPGPALGAAGVRLPSVGSQRCLDAGVGVCE